MEKKLLFVTYGGGHAHMVHPVVAALRQTAPGLSIHVLALPAAKDILRRNGVECVGFDHYLDETTDADALVWGRELAKQHHSANLGIDINDSIAYLGLCYKDMVIRLGKEQAAKLFREKARNSFYPLIIMERIFDDIKPNFVITTNSPRAEAAAIETANRRGIDNLIMADLFTGLGHYRLQARNIAFFNEFAKNMFAADGLLDEKNSHFYYTGNPAFDKILTLPKEKDTSWIRAHFPQAQGSNIILHADMPAYWDPAQKRSHIKTSEEMLEELDACYEASMRNDAFYLIRPHPSQDRALYAQWLKGKKNAALAADHNLHELLRNIDVLLARTTTVGLEAAYMHKKIIQLDADFHSDLPLAKMGIAWGVNSYDALIAAIKSALTDDTKWHEIKNKIRQLLPHEPASSKIAQIILGKLEVASRQEKIQGQR